jgi:hypothetical protein
MVVDDMRRSAERVHYLSLALDARLVIKALRQKSPTEATNAELQGSLRAVLDSLRAINRGGDMYSRLGDLEPYEHFEQIYTLQEVSASLNDPNLLKELEGLSAPEGPSAAVKVTALKFFSEVERRALHYYSDPCLSEMGG